MKTEFLLVCVLALAAADKYHRRVGIPTATKIRQQESMRIVGGLSSYKGEHPYFVVLGTVTLFSGGTRKYANSVTVHPEYNPNTLANDVTMINVPYISMTSYIDSITLPVAYISSLEGFTAEIIGFGRTSPTGALDGSSSLRDVFVKVLSNVQCSQVYGSIVTLDIMCTSGDNGKGACGGDYGGPLILRRYLGASGEDLLVGLVSFTAAAGCNAGYPTGYTRITSYLRWINRFL